jgi:hypothetical protein
MNRDSIRSYDPLPYPQWVEVVLGALAHAPDEGTDSDGLLSLLGPHLERQLLLSSDFEEFEYYRRQAPHVALGDLMGLGLVHPESEPYSHLRLTDSGVRAVRTSIADECNLRAVCRGLSPHARRYVVALREYVRQAQEQGWEPPNAGADILKDSGLLLKLNDRGSFDRANHVMAELHDKRCISYVPSDTAWEWSVEKKRPVYGIPTLLYAGYTCAKIG